MFSISDGRGPCNSAVTLTQHCAFAPDGKVVSISLSDFLAQGPLIISSYISALRFFLLSHLEVNLLLSLALALIEEGMDDPIAERVDCKFWNPDQ